MKRKLIALILLLGSMIAHAQEKKLISGIVKDSVGNGIQGVTVSVKGTGEATTSNSQGGFSIAAADRAVLVFSFVGYERQEAVVHGGSMTIMLSRKAGQLDEVVVTALGIRKDKQKVSYAVQEINGGALQKAPEPDIATNMVGKVAGLEIDTRSTMFEDPAILLRGGAAMVVIDGVATDPNSFDFWSIDPNTIDNITVLKGPAAAALYGSDGKNGAIMITTKKGKSGANGVEVTVNSTNQFQAGFLRLPKTQKQYGMGFNGYYAFVNGYDGGGDWYDEDGYVWGPKLNVKDASNASGYFEVPQYNSPYNPNTLYSFTENGYTGQSNYQPTPYITRGQNNLKNFLRPELISTDNVSIAGKTDRSDYRISFTDMYQKGQVPNTQLSSTTLTLAGSIKVTDKLKVEGTLAYNRQNSPNYPEFSTNGSGQSGAGPGDYFYDILLFMGPDVNIKDLKNYWKYGGPNEYGNAFGTKNLQQYNYNYEWYNNPWFTAYENLHEYTNEVVTGELSGTYEFTKELNLLVRSGLSTHNAFGDEKQPWSYIDNNFTLRSQGNYSFNQYSSIQLVSDALLTYKKSFPDGFHATVSGGASTRYNELRDNQGGTVGGLTVPKWYNTAASVETPQSSNSLAESQFSSLLGYVDVDYKNMVYLNGTARNDWVSDLPKPYNSFFYPSASLGVVASQIFQLPKAISYAKFRGSWAQISNNSLNVYGTPSQDWYVSLPVYTTGPRWNGNSSLNLPGTMVPPGLKPNSRVSQEYGGEFKFLQNRLGVDFAWYKYDDKNYVVQAPVSAGTGYDNVLVNGGATTQKGYEIVLTGTPIRTKNLKWDITVNYAVSHQYQKSYFGGAQIEGGIPVGGRTDAYFAQAWEKSPDGKVVYDSSGNPVSTPYNVNLGHTDPKFIFGIINNLSYKSFSFSFSFDGRIGGILYDGVEAQLYDAGNHPAEVNSYRDDAYLGKATYSPGGVVVTSGSVQYNALDGQVVSDTRKFTANTTKVNYVNWVRSFYRGGAGARSAEIYSRSFVKLREVTLTYSLPNKLTAGTPFKSASVSLTGRNLFLWTKVPFLDPDGYNNYALGEPSYRNLGLNISLKF